MNTGNSWTPLAPVNTIQENAELAWAFIQARMRDTNAHEVDVVAHSLGGVIARRILHDPAFGVKAQEAIHTVVLLGPRMERTHRTRRHNPAHRARGRPRQHDQ